MRPREQVLVAVTRGSALALAQTDEVLAACRKKFPRLRFERKVVRTTGDKLQKASLSGGKTKLPKGLFTKELEAELIRRRADFAVHSLKDLPVDLPPGLCLAAVPKRRDPRDALICRSRKGAARLQETLVSQGRPAERVFGIDGPPSLQALPEGARVGTSSERRRWQLTALRPDLRVAPLRGNVPTRLEKLLADPKWDAVLLALAGLERLGYEIDAEGALALWTSRLDAPGGGLAPERLEDYAAAPIPIDQMLPAVGQAALGLEIRSGDGRVEAVCKTLDHYLSRRRVEAERAFLRAVGGGCHSPIAAFAEAQGERLLLRAAVWTGSEIVRAERLVSLAGAEAEAEALAAEMRPLLPSS